MATAAQFRKLALSLTDSEEGFHVDHADFRVRGKIFAGLTRDEKRASFKLSPETQSMIVEEASGAFAPAAGAWGAQGWTYAELASVKIGALEELVRESHAIIAAKAPKKKTPKKKAAAPRRKTAAKR